MAIVVFTMNLGASISLIAANAIFSNSLRNELTKRIDTVGVSPDIIIGAGVRSVRQYVQGSALASTLEAYCRAIDHTMYLGIALSICILPFAWGLGWVDVRKVKKLNAITAEKPSNDAELQKGNDAQ